MTAAGGGAPGHTGADLLHVLALKGAAPLPALTIAVGGPPAEVSGRLQQLAAAGLVEFRAPRELWRVTAEGRRRDREGLSVPSGRTREALVETFRAFLDLNHHVKDLCTRWQVRDGRPNVHDDPGYDHDLVEQLTAADHRAHELIGQLASGLEQLSGYATRLGAALERTRAGELRAFTGVMCESYHEIWMELHKDLLSSLGIERDQEELLPAPAATYRQA